MDLHTDFLWLFSFADGSTLSSLTCKSGKGFQVNMLEKVLIRQSSVSFSSLSLCHCHCNRDLPVHLSTSDCHGPSPVHSNADRYTRGWNFGQKPITLWCGIVKQGLEEYSAPYGFGHGLSLLKDHSHPSECCTLTDWRHCWTRHTQAVNWKSQQSLPLSSTSLMLMWANLIWLPWEILSWTPSACRQTLELPHRCHCHRGRPCRSSSAPCIQRENKCFIW